MRSAFIVLAVAALAWLSFAPRSRAQSAPAAPAPAVVHGVVMDSAGAPISGAVLSAMGTTLRARSDSAGRFRLEGVPPGLTIFSVRAIGYRPILWSLNLAAGQSASGRIGLRQLAIQLPELVVIGQQIVPSRMEGFYRRKELGLGRYIDRETIERRFTSRLTDLLLGIPGVRVNKERDNPFDFEVRFPRCGRIGVYVDGFKVQGDVGESLALINPADVEGIEVYRGPSELPAEFMSDDCAAIVVWTRYN